MHEESGTSSVKEQLIIAGIEELENHGIADFSLRRVASACNLSCAAPYRHFQDKDCLINEIFLYIHSQLDLLLSQVREVFAAEPEKQIAESGVAYIRFCLANPHFRAILTLSGDNLPLKDIVKPLLCKCLPNVSEEELTLKEMVIRSVIYGAAVSLESGELTDTKQTLDDVRLVISEIINK